MKTISYDTIEMSDEQRDQFDLLADRLVERNRQVNLTAITDPEEIREKHFADSLAILEWKGLAECRKALDLGTGGGFPGLPIAIVCPQIDVTMMDSVEKKLGFVDEMIGELGLANARTLWERAEEAGRSKDYRETYDLVVSRAVAPLPVLIEYSLPFLRIGGAFVAYKSNAGKEIDESGRALSELGGTAEEVMDYAVAGGDKRSLIIIRKTQPTPDKYPRRTGKPAKSPLV